MNLGQLRAEVQIHGFGTTDFPASRINAYLNDGYLLACRRVDYYADEATQTIATSAGVATFPLPGNWARIRSLLDTDREVELDQVGLRDIDRAWVQQGTPLYYAQDGTNIHLYPTPDGVHNLQLRYWLLPAILVLDTDTPTIPTDWHRLLSEYAIARCYWGEDDIASGQQWDQKFATTLAEFEADVRFPSTDYPTRVKSMWGDGGLGSHGWTRFPNVGLP